MSPNFQIVFGYILVAVCAIGTLGAGIMVKNGYDRKREQSISRTVVTQQPPESKASEKESKQKLAKIHINRIIEDTASWLDETIEQNKIETNRISNDFNSRGMFNSGPHISVQIKRVNNFIKSVNDYIKDRNRKIEDILLDLGEERFDSVTWLVDEYRKYTGFIEKTKAVKNSIKQQNNELCSRITDKPTFDNIQKSMPYSE